MMRTTWIRAVYAILLWAGSAQAGTTPEASLNNCQSAVKAATQQFVSKKLVAIGSCLQAVSTEIVKNNKPNA